MRTNKERSRWPYTAAIFIIFLCNFCALLQRPNVSRSYSDTENKIKSVKFSITT